MMAQILTEKLERLNTSTPETVSLLKNLFVQVSFRKGVILNAPDHSFPILYFIETGLVRGYVYYGKTDYTCWILKNGFLLPSLIINAAEVQTEYVAFLTDTTGWSLNLSMAEATAQEHPLMYRMLLEIYQESITEGKARELMLRLHTAGERMTYAKMRYGKLMDKVLHPILASFLNIETKYLYKIMKKCRTDSVKSRQK